MAVSLRQCQCSYLLFLQFQANWFGEIWIINRNARFTLSLGQHEIRQKHEWKGYIHLVLYALHFFLSHFVALRKMSVNCTRIKGHECLPSLSKLLLITLLFSSWIFLPSIFYSGKFFLNLLGKLLAVSWLFQSCTYQLCLVALAQKCECLHLCVPCLIHNLPKVSMSALNESVNPA